MICIDNVSKSYGELRALDEVRFEVRPGEVFGLLGHNGAGKSTLAKILSGLLRPDAGTVRIAGLDVATAPLEARARFGYLPEESVLYDELSAREHLELIAALRRVPAATARARTTRLLDFLDLAAAADRPVGTYSRGMRRKTALAVALVGDPQAVLLDEPTGGLDPDGTHRFAELLGELRRRERAVIISSHILGLVEKRCDRVGVLERGRLIACGTPDELRARAGLPGADLEDVFLALTGRTGRDARGLLDGEG
ncbi:MAG: ABC transporter ATP-binding protein [Planctomycetota bacterium]|nr:MAG: ABC transporter ATP-binding protein [Planctomycetota bacterium]